MFVTLQPFGVMTSSLGVLHTLGVTLSVALSWCLSHLRS